MNCLVNQYNTTSVMIMNRSDYIEKLEGMIEERIKKGTYKKNRRYSLTRFEKNSRFFVQKFLYMRTL